MKKETQDRLWAILSKNEREELRKAYATPAQSHYSEGYDNARDCYFGHHNLTSDEEPSELLFVERNKVIRHYANSKDNLEHSKHDYRCLFEQGEMQVIECFFGDKCLPDKEPSVQVEPMFKVGDKVIYKGAIYEIREANNGVYPYKINKDGWTTWAKESELEPYTESETKRKETQGLSRLDEQSIETKDAHEQHQETMAKESRQCDESENDILYEKDGISLENESKIDEMMEEKELNLLELLKGCEDETFYSPALGTVWIHSINDEEIEIIATSDDYAITVDGTGKWNLFFKTHVCILFPSKELYEKYPLDAAKAWNEWAEEGKSKHILQAQIRLISKDGKTVEDYEKVELEVSDMDLTQAAEAVKKCLEEFHAKNTEK